MLGENIKKYRKELRMSQTELAEQLNVTQASITAWERGTRKPDIDMLSALANIFHVSTDRLLGRSDEAPSESFKPPITVAAHLEGELTPAQEERIKEIIRLAIEKYDGKSVK